MYIQLAGWISFSSNIIGCDELSHFFDGPSDDRTEVASRRQIAEIEYSDANRVR